MTYKTALRKRKIEQLGMFPFVLAGRLYGKLFRLKNKTSYFLFYSGDDLGGATRVNADVANCLRDKKPLIIYSKKPKNSGYKALFDGYNIFDLRHKIDNKLFHFINFFYRGVLAEWINSSNQPVVLGGENLYFYKILPHLRKDVIRVDICHLSTWFHYTIGFIDLITRRVFSTTKLMDTLKQQYDENKLDLHYYNRLVFIENKVDIPPYKRIENEALQVLYVGRGAPQKRVYLIAAIAEKANALGIPVHFSFVGDVENVFDISKYPYCTFYGNVRDEKKMKDIYLHADMLILTSAYEGLPVAIMEMMSFGKGIISTAVDSIPDYIKHMQNGLLITETEEDNIVEQSVEFMRLLVSNPELKYQLGLKGREMAIEKFGGEVFCKAYTQVLKGE